MMFSVAMQAIFGDAGPGFDGRSLTLISGPIQSVAYRWATDQQPLTNNGQWLRVPPGTILESLIWTVWSLAVVQGCEAMGAQRWNSLGVFAFSWICSEAIRSEATQIAAMGAFLATLTYWRMNEGVLRSARLQETLK